MRVFDFRFKRASFRRGHSSSGGTYAEEPSLHFGISRPHLSSSPPQLLHVRPPKSAWRSARGIRKLPVGGVVPHREQGEAFKLIPQLFRTIVPCTTLAITTRSSPIRTPKATLFGIPNISDILFHTKWLPAHVIRTRDFSVVYAGMNHCFPRSAPIRRRAVPICFDPSRGYVEESCAQSTPPQGSQI